MSGTRFSSECIPDHILRLMPEHERKLLGKAGRTADEAQAIFTERTEKEMHITFESWLNLHNLPFIHSRMDRATTTNLGVPDFAVFYQERALLIEFKMPSSMLSEDQKTYHAKLDKVGASPVVCFSAEQAIKLAREFVSAKPTTICS